MPEASSLETATTRRALVALDYGLLVVVVAIGVLGQRNAEDFTSTGLSVVLGIALAAAYIGPVGTIEKWIKVRWIKVQTRSQSSVPWVSRGLVLAMTIITLGALASLLFLPQRAGLWATGVLGILGTAAVLSASQSSETTG